MNDETNEKFNDENEEETTEFSTQGEPDVAVVLKRIQQQLAFLEKKIDLLLNQSSSQPSERSFRGGDRDRRFSKPFRPGGDRGGPPRFGKRGDRPDRDRGPRDRDFSQGGGSGRSFNRGGEGDNRGYSQGGDRGGDRGFGQGGGESRGFGGPRKKPFFPRRRTRG